MLWRGSRMRKWKWRRRYSLQVLDILRLAEVLQVGEVADKVWVFEVFGGGEVVDVELFAGMLVVVLGGWGCLGNEVPGGKGVWVVLGWTAPVRIPARARNVWLLRRSRGRGVCLGWWWWWWWWWRRWYFELLLRPWSVVSAFEALSIEYFAL